MNNIFDVIIVGGGPVGTTLAIELGLNNIKTLVLEKYLNHLLSPRAQSLSSRSMEFLMRLGVAETLKSRVALPHDLPHQGVWCSKLNGNTYGIGGVNLGLNTSISPEKYIRVPLWHTEEVLREKLSTLSSVQFLKETPVDNLTLSDEHISVEAKHKGKPITYKAKYLIGCDGAKSITRNIFNMRFTDLAPKRRVINILFETDELAQKITVARGFIYYILENKYPSVIGLVDNTRNLWYSQIVYDNDITDINLIDLDILLNEITGINFKKNIVQSHFWEMQPQIAEKFSYNNKVFLVGDSAHAFVPTGGFGLNTGLAGALNFAWKLAAVIKKEAKPSLLETYEIERRPIVMRNLEAAQHNAQNVVEIRKKHDPKIDPEGFARANSEAATTHSQSLGLAMGYAYFNSPLIKLNTNQETVPMLQSVYTPRVEPGYFLPHIMLENIPIYTKLSATNWTLITSNTSDKEMLNTWLNQVKQLKIDLDILFVPNNSYPTKYILIRPDWHIAFTSNELNDDYIIHNLRLFF